MTTPRFWRGIAVLAGVALVGLGALTLLEALSRPWALSLTGGPTLVGEWYGEMTTPTGQRRVVHLRLESLRGRGPDLGGTAQWCDGQGGLQQYTVWGHTENWRGTQFGLNLRKVEERSYELRLYAMQGEWNQDTVRLTTTLYSDTYNYSIRTERDHTGKETTTKVGVHPDTLTPVLVTLGRGREQDFVAACRQRKAP